MRRAAARPRRRSARSAESPELCACATAQRRRLILRPSLHNCAGASFRPESLERCAHAQITAQEGDRKQYAITPAGAEFLAGQQAALDAINERLDHAGRPGHAMRAPEVQRALLNFRMALHLRLARGTLGDAQIRAITEAIDAAAKAIERS